MRILIWASALQADILALAQHLDLNTDHELLIAATDIATYQTQAFAQKRPFTCRLIERTSPTAAQQAIAFKADVAVIDNHFPDFPCATAICKMWHGLGWKAPDRMDLYFAAVKRLSGNSPDFPNPRFLAQCYGPHDQAFRQTGMNIHPDNCRIVGMPFAELIHNPPYTKQELAPRYSIDVMARKTVLVNFTWHYGSITNQKKTLNLWQRLFKNKKSNLADLDFLDQLCQAITHKGANILFCMHDRGRYDQRHLSIFYEIERRFPNRIQIKFKNEHPDNLSDLLIADVMVSNLSSFITFFYATGRPSIHLCPTNKNDKEVTYARASRKGVKLKIRAVDESFMMQPDDNGGLTAYTHTECINHICYALDNPNCCEERLSQFFAAKLPPATTGSCARFTTALEELHHKSLQKH